MPLVEDLEQMPGYSKLMKDLMTKKRSIWNFETIKVTHQVSAIVHFMAPKLEDPSTFAIPCTIRSADFAKALCDLGASINLMPYSVFKILGIGKPRPISMRLKIVDHTMKRPLRVIEDILVRVDKFIIPVHFVILDYEVDYEVPIILERPFLAMDTSTTINVGDILEAVLHKFDDDEMDGFMECVDSTLVVLQKRKKAIGWTSADIRGISPVFCMHKIKLEDSAKSSIEHKVRLNEAMQGVVKKEIFKWLDVRVVYPIFDSSWTSLVQRIPKKGGMTVVTNDKNDLIPTRTVTDWRVCMDYRKLNKVTKRITFLSLSWTKCLIGWPAVHSIAFLIVTRATTKFLLLWKIKRKPPFMSTYLSSGLYASKTVNSVQVNYTITKKDLLDIVFAIKKFRTYLMGAKIIVHTDHAVLRYLMSKKEYKARLMRLVILLQEFDIDIQDKKGSKNQVVDHLFRLKEEGRPHDGLEINGSFPDEQLLELLIKEVPWFVNLANFLMSGIISDEFLSNQRKKLKQDCQDYYWDKPYLFRITTDMVIRRCVLEVEQGDILGACHSLLYGGHHGGARTAAKVLSCGFYQCFKRTPFSFIAASSKIKLKSTRQWAMKKLNLCWDLATKLWVSHLNELDEFRYHAHESSSLYKEKMKYLHDKYIWNKEFKAGDLVLLFNSRLRMFPGKLKSKWSGPFEIVGLTPFGALNLKNKNNEIFRVNGHRVKHYLGKTMVRSRGRGESSNERGEQGKDTDSDDVPDDRRGGLSAKADMQELRIRWSRKTNF
ncbi:uncharacterized protein [Nicotiana tomentosiformis]|uniref:uncharacterized protein n=1 Tax=Nicotiana tomentosiformis TaxID=4098 RepID=UPI00388C9187